MLSNGFLLHIEKFVRILNSKLPEYSRISCVFKEIDNNGINVFLIYMANMASQNMKFPFGLVILNILNMMRIYHINLMLELNQNRKHIDVVNMSLNILKILKKK